MAEAKDIDHINNIIEMGQTMSALGISAEGLQTLEEMKDRVKKTLEKSEKISSWTAKEAFSVLTEAKEEDERKRGILYQFYEDTEDCLNTMDEKVRLPLETKIGNLYDKMAMNKRNLKEKNYIVLVTGFLGETCSGKSTVLDLILGEELLPCSTLSTTSTICELKYGPTPKLVAHLKDKNLETGDTTKTVWLGQPVEASQKSYLQEISSFVHVETNQNYKKIELFWPHSLLKQGIVIVDSPGIGENDIMDNMVMKYFPKAFAFIYVVNVTNAGGIQKDRVVKLIEHARNVTLDQQNETLTRQPPARALFVCNKWDLVPPEETEKVKNHIIKKLAKCWPSLDPESQVICMSSTNARKAQDLGIITEQFSSLMNGIKSMVLKSMEARLQTQWRWLDYLLFNMTYQTKAFLRISLIERWKVSKKMMFITERLKKIEEEQSSIEDELQKYLDNKTDNAVRALSNHLTSAVVVTKFTSWTLDDVPNKDENDKNFIQTALMMRLGDLIAAWEEENHVFADARTSLIQYFQERFNFVEGQLRNLTSEILEEVDPTPASDPLASVDFYMIDNIIIDLTNAIRFPVILMRSIKEIYEEWSRKREFMKEKCVFMVKASTDYLAKATEEQNLRLHVVEQLRECQVYLKQIVARIPELIQADKMLCQHLSDEKRSKKEIQDFYAPLYQRSLELRGKMAFFGTKDVSTMDISCSDLEWRDDESSLLGMGAFASVYRGKLKQPDGEHPVALKVWKEKLNDTNASAFVTETENLRRLNYPSIVKFYGAALRKEGDQMRGILVMELCKENLRSHIFNNPMNIPSLPSSTHFTYRNTIRWAKNIANALEFIHRQGLVHRDLKLENILISQEDVVKVADVGQSKEAKMITGTLAGTPAYIAPEVMNSSMYDTKADMYSFGIMMWEMWYGRRILPVAGEDWNTFSHVEGRRKPPGKWERLMQSCLDYKADRRPTASMCHMELLNLHTRGKSCM